MTNQEWESGMNELREALQMTIRTFSLQMEAMDKKWDERFERLLANQEQVKREPHV